MRIRTGIALGLLLTLTVGGCGSAGGNPGVATANRRGSATTSPTGNALSEHEQGLKLARCMREHGIDMPDPEEGGGIRLPGVVSDPQKLEAAMQACRTYLPNGGQPQKPDAQRLEQLRKLAQCMREHGVANFPYPDPNAGLKVGGSDVDPNDPKVQQAQQACAKYQPGGPSTNTQSNE